MRHVSFSFREEERLKKEAEEQEIRRQEEEENNARLALEAKRKERQEELAKTSMKVMDSVAAVQSEKKLEAVFFSFAEHGKWSPLDVIFPDNTSATKGMTVRAFLGLCHAANLDKSQRTPPKTIRDIFVRHCDTVSAAKYHDSSYPFY